MTIWDEQYFDVPDNTPADQILNIIEENDIMGYDQDYLLDTSCEMDIHENDGNATAEVYDNANQLIYKNGK